MPIVWSYWELKPGTSQNKIAYYDLIWRSVLKNIDPSTKLVLLTPENICYYLNWIHPRVYDVPHIAQRVDYIRVAILYHYGGMWIDLDSLLIKDLEYFLHLGKSYPFIAVNYSIDHFDHDSYFWVHDPLMVSEAGGKVITTFYEKFNEYFDRCSDLGDMPYDQSSRLLTLSLKSNEKSSYFLLAHNDLDKIPQHCAHIWFKKTTDLRQDELEILKEWSERCKLNICGSAHLNSYIQQYHKKEDITIDEFITYLFSTSIGYMLEKSGISQYTDGFAFKHYDLTGMVCPYRKIILVDSIHLYRDEVRDSFFYHREKTLEIDLERLPLKEFYVLTSVSSDIDYSSFLEKVDSLFPDRKNFFCFPIEEADRFIKLIYEHTKSICVREKTDIVGIKSKYEGLSYRYMLNQNISIEPVNREDRLSIAPVSNNSGLPPFLKEEWCYYKNRAQIFKYGESSVWLYDTFSRGVLLCILSKSGNAITYQLANLVINADPNRFIYSNSVLRANNMINCSNDAFIAEWPKCEIIGDEIKINFILIFDRYLKKSRYDGFYVRYRLHCTLCYMDETWRVNIGKNKNVINIIEHEKLL